MSFLKILLLIIIIVLVCGLAYYYKTITAFKKLLQFEVAVKQHPSDEGVRDYIELYRHTYVPNQPKVQASRSAFYRTIKGSNEVSYEVKKELRSFFEEKGISVLTTMKKEESDEAIEE